MLLSNVATVALNVTPALTVPGLYTTIQAAINGATSGDSILVAPGVYHENLIWNAKDLTLIGSGFGDDDRRRRIQRVGAPRQQPVGGQLGERVHVPER